MNIGWRILRNKPRILRPLMPIEHPDSVMHPHERIFVVSYFFPQKHYLHLQCLHVSRVYSRNWPMRVKWAPFLSFEGPFSRNGAKKGGCKYKKTECFLRLLTFYMGHACWMLCRHFGTFWATEKAWAKITAHPRCVWWNNDSNEEEKSNWDSKRL